MPRLRQIKHHYLLFFLIGIVVVGGVLRTFELGTSVTTLNRDEAALAYNAYLLKEVGVDEWGVKWPLTLQSFGDYKLIGYPLLLTVLYRFLPMTDTTVRLPAALAGIGLLLVSYSLGRRFGLRPSLAVVFSSVIALSPVFIFFSRFAYEANVALLYVMSSLLLWFKPNRTLGMRLLFDAVGILLFTLACFTYNSPFMLFPLFIGVIIVSRISKGLKSWLPLLLLFIMSFCFVTWQLLPVLQQKSGISIFTDATVAHHFAVFRQRLAPILQSIVGNRYVYWLGVVFTNAINSFSPTFLLLRPLHPWHGIIGWGQLLWPVVLLGWGGALWLIVWLATLLRWVVTKQTNLSTVTDSKVFQLACLLLLSLVPAVITVDAPHATRSLVFLYLFSLLAILFFQFVLQLWQNKFSEHRWLTKLPLFVLVLLLCGTAAKYSYDLFVHYPIDAQNIYRAGFVNALTTVADGSQVAIVDPDGYQYILLAWYLRVAPSEYLHTNIRQLPNKIGFRYGERVGKYHFIAQAKDQSASESALIQWSDETSTWQITP